MKTKILYNRRSFIKVTTAGTAMLTLTPSLLEAKHKGAKLVILHTNDVHSQIEPFPLDDKNFSGMGGFARRAEIINNIRNQEEHVLLLDAGDYFQGTPYFNFFKGEVEVKLMNKLKYDAVTIGNHEFDNGADMLFSALKMADFPVLNANYEFHTRAWKTLVKPYHVFQKGAFKVGVIGLGIDPKGMIDPKNFVGIDFSDPLTALNKYADELKNQNCNLIIALTHLGIEHDREIAQNSTSVDVVLGGHSHTFLKEPELIINAAGRKVLINQVGKSGLFLGRINLYLDDTTLQHEAVHPLY